MKKLINNSSYKSKTNSFIKKMGKQTSNWAQNDEETEMYLKMIQEIVGVKEEEVTKIKKPLRKQLVQHLI